MKFDLVLAATSALLARAVYADSADSAGHDKKLDWSPPCDDHEPARTITRYYTIYLPPETVDAEATRTIYHPTMGDGRVRYSRTTSVSTVFSPTATTIKTITSFRTVSTTTRTITRTSTVAKPKGFVPAKDTVFGYPKYDEGHLGGHYDKRDVAEAADLAEAAEPEKVKGDEKARAKSDWYPEHHECHDHYGPDGIYTVEKLTTITPPCMTKTYYETCTRSTTVIPTTISITSSFARTTTVRDGSTILTTVIVPTTATRTTYTTTEYYAACATSNVILTGPDGNTIVNVFNNGRKYASTYDLGFGDIRTPYECCVACQKSSTCQGSVFRTGSEVCLLLRAPDRQCGPQCEHEIEYTTDPENRSAGLVVSDGQCGYMRWGGHNKQGVPPFTGSSKLRQPGL